MLLLLPLGLSAEGSKVANVCFTTPIKGLNRPSGSSLTALICRKLSGLIHTLECSHWHNMNSHLECSLPKKCPEWNNITVVSNIIILCFCNCATYVPCMLSTTEVAASGLNGRSLI